MQKEGTYSIGKVANMLKVEQHTIRYIEGIIKLEVKRDQYQNRQYTIEDISRLKTVLNLKSQGLNYKAIKTVLAAKEEIKAGEINESQNRSLVNPNQNIEQFISLMKVTINDSINDAFDKKAKGLESKLENMQQQLERIEEKHFKELDLKISKLREDKKNYQKKSWIERVFNF